MWRGTGQLDGLHVVGRIEAHLPAVQPPAAPTLLILFTQLGELIAWEGDTEELTDRGLGEDDPSTPTLLRKPSYIINAVPIPKPSPIIVPMPSPGDQPKPHLDNHMPPPATHLIWVSATSSFISLVGHCSWHLRPSGPARNPAPTLFSGLDSAPGTQLPPS